MKEPSYSSHSEYSLSLPPFIWLTLFFFIPTVFVFLYAFKPFNIYGGIESGWTLETIKSLANSFYIVVIWRTLWISVVTTAVSLALALPVGYFIARAKASVRGIILLLTILPFWSSFIVRVFAWKLMLHPDGFVKKVLVAMHLASPDAVLLYRPSTVIIVMVYTFIPFAILPIYAAASKFNFQLIEAALDLGMTRFKAFFKVFLPGIRAAILTALLMVFIPALGSYVIPDILGGPQTELIGNKIVQRTFTERNLPQASALSAFLTLAVVVPMMVITLLQSRVKKRKAMRAKL